MPNPNRQARYPRDLVKLLNDDTDLDALVFDTNLTGTSVTLPVSIDASNVALDTNITGSSVALDTNISGADVSLDTNITGQVGNIQTTVVEEVDTTTRRNFAEFVDEDSFTASTSGVSNTGTGGVTISDSVLLDIRNEAHLLEIDFRTFDSSTETAEIEIRGYASTPERLTAIHSIQFEVGPGGDGDLVTIEFEFSEVTGWRLTVDGENQSGDYFGTSNVSTAYEGPARARAGQNEVIDYEVEVLSYTGNNSSFEDVRDNVRLKYDGVSR